MAPRTQDHLFREERNLDRICSERDAANKALVLANKENELLKKEHNLFKKHDIGRSISRAVIISVVVAAAAYTGNGWFIFLALLALL